ncbi:unnamed protein product [Bemisia tabaci]|uniref:Uncharacterized protein n=1 Tax=Bemisia tabaci TaxID=7038 RepID=A0A9P0A0Z9_BEMTA|nr:unnamed protein product [Bemisia tabaci]
MSGHSYTIRHLLELPYVPSTPKKNRCSLSPSHLPPAPSIMPFKHFLPPFVHKVGFAFVFEHYSVIEASPTDWEQTNQLAFFILSNAAKPSWSTTDRLLSLLDLWSSSPSHPRPTPPELAPPPLTPPPPSARPACASQTESVPRPNFLAPRNYCHIGSDNGFIPRGRDYIPRFTAPPNTEIPTSIYRNSSSKPG